MGSLIIISRFACHFPRVELGVNELEVEENELTWVNSRFCWISIRNGETGNVVKIREYLDTALCEGACAWE